MFAINKLKRLSTRQKIAGVLMAVLMVAILNLVLTAFNASAAPTSPNSTTISASAAPASPFKNYLSLGVANFDNSWISTSGVPLDFRYQYLAGDVTGNNWAVWNSPDGAFADYYMADSKAVNTIPVFTYYMMAQSSPGASQGETAGTYANYNNASTMNAYFSNFRLLMQRCAAFGQPVIVHVEPDLWGFMQQRNANPAAITAKVASSNFGDVAAGKPDTVAGFAQTLVALRDKYAPNVTLGYHVSGWASGQDIGTNTDPSLNVGTVASSLYGFYSKLGANFDVFFWDMSDRDADYYAQWDNGAHWWDATNQTLPNFKRFASVMSSFYQLSGKKNVIWQIPLGNSKQNNTINHWRDNRVEYLLGNLGGGYINNLKDYTNAGVVALMFGAGAGDQTSYEDDSGVFQSLAKAYYNNRVYLSGSTTSPTPTATATKTATAVPPTATPTKTATAVPPTATPTKTATAVPPTATPTKTATAVPPTATPTKTATAVPNAVNVLTNGGFENSSTGWFLQTPFTITTNTANVYSGSKALKLSSTSPQWENAAQTVNVQANKNYTLTFWAKGQKTPYVDIMTTNWDVLYRVSVNATSGYTKYTLSFNSGSNTQIVLGIRDSLGSGTTFFDDFSLVAN